MDTVSIFNKTVKGLLVDLKAWAPSDTGVKWVRKAYMSKKQEDPNGPLNAFADFVSKAENRQAIENMDVEHLKTCPELKVFSGTIDVLKEEQIGKVFDYLKTMLVVSDTIGTLSTDSIQTIEHMAQKCAKEGDPQSIDIASVIEKTTMMMPKVFEQLGMQVSEEEIQGAAKHIQNSNMMNIFTTLMKNNPI